MAKRSPSEIAIPSSPGVRPGLVQLSPTEAESDHPPPSSFPGEARLPPESVAQFLRACLLRQRTQANQERKRTSFRLHAQSRLDIRSFGILQSSLPPDAL